jgi:AsmA-like C-terminal region
MLTAVFAAGALFVKFQLEAYRVDVEKDLEARLGVSMSAGAITVDGLRGLRIDDLELHLPFEDGPVLNVVTPSAYVNINLNDLLYGRMTVEQIILDHSAVSLVRPEGGVWYALNESSGSEHRAVLSPSTDAFRITGEQCTLNVENIVGRTSVTVDLFSFDIARMKDASTITANLEGNLSGDAEKHIDVKVDYESQEEFNVRIDTHLITANDLSVVFPSDDPLLLSGEIHPLIRIYGGPDSTVVLNMQAPFEEVLVKNQPEFLEPATGVATFFANYDIRTHKLHITTAKADTNQLYGTVEGAISFAGDYPVFDVQLTADQIPIEDILKYTLDEEIDKYGTLDLTLQEPHELILNLSGPSNEAVIVGEARAAGGTFAFVPDDDQYPPLELKLGTLAGKWDTQTQAITGTIDVVDGAISHEESGIQATNISGTVALADNALTMERVNAVIRDNAFVGSFLYDIDSGDADLTLNGTLTGLENTSFQNAVKHITLGGAINVKCDVGMRDDRITVDAFVDATQAEMDYQWWFKKPPGIGASGAIHVDLALDESALIRFDAEVASSQLLAGLEMRYYEHDGATGWHLEQATLTSNDLDVNALAKCIALPYDISGGKGFFGHLKWERDPENYDYNHMEYGAFFDDIVITAVDDDANSPIHLSDAQATIFMDTGVSHTGSVRLDVQRGEMPPFGETWLIPVAPPPDSPLKEREWTYDFQAGYLDLPPWSGRNFNGHLVTTSDEIRFTRYEANIEKGHLEGSYHATRADNVYTTRVNWANIPAHYFLEHLKYDDILSGSMTGEVQYTVDEDDPNTLAGSGYFEVKDGQFRSDFLYSLLQGSNEDSVITLPSNLDFSMLRADVEFLKDTVKTPVLKLESPGISLEGTGQFIRDGDMDYALKVAVSPEMAESIPILSENFNIQGHKISQRDIELAFNIGGPTFNPSGQLAELPPASVTLVSGALEMTREAINIIDFPRKILVDLVKIGGGIIASGSTNKN